MVGCVQKKVIVHKADCHLVAIEGQKQPRRFLSQAAAAIFLNQTVKRLMNKGYWYYSVDTIRRDTCLKFSVFKGPKIERVNITEFREGRALPPIFLKPAGALLLPDIRVAELANSGYPFANARYERPSYDSAKRQLNLNLEINPSLKMFWDTLSLQPKGLISKKVLANYLQLKTGSIYRESDWQQVEPKLRNLEFAKPQSVKPLFHDKSVIPILSLGAVKANEAEGMLGLIPQDGGRPGLTLMGQLKATLNNLFGQGHKMQFQWQRIRPLTQTLDFQYRTLTFAKLPIGVQTGLSLFRSDTAFLQLGLKAGFAFQYGGNLRWSLGLERLSTQLITNSPDYARSLGIGSRTAIGLNTQFSYRLIGEGAKPLKGLYLLGEAAVFQRQILASVVDSTTTSNNQIRVRFLAGYWLPLSSDNRRIMGFKYQGGTISGNNLAKNEQFFLGGFRNLRGFNENNFSARSFSVSTVDIRFYSLEGSFLSVFSDYGRLQITSQNQAQSLEVLALGIGLGLKLQGGLLQIQVAAGSTTGIRGLELDAARLHLGYYAQF